MMRMPQVRRGAESAFHSGEEKESCFNKNVGICLAIGDQWDWSPDDVLIGNLLVSSVRRVAYAWLCRRSVS